MIKGYLLYIWYEFVDFFKIPWEIDWKEIGSAFNEFIDGLLKVLLILLVLLWILFALGSPILIPLKALGSHAWIRWRWLNRGLREDLTGIRSADMLRGQIDDMREQRQKYSDQGRTTEAGWTSEAIEQMEERLVELEIGFK